MKSDWRRSPLGEHCDVIAGQSPSGAAYNEVGLGMPFYQGKKEFSEKYIGLPTVWTTKVTKTARNRDILMSVRAPVGPVNFATQDICIGRGLAAIRCGSTIDPEFLFYQLLHLKPIISGKEGAVFASINRSEIAALPLVIPPLSEQKRIVAILDEAFEAIETAKTNAETNRQNATELLETYLTELLLRRSEKWRDEALSEICVVERGSSPRPIKKYFTTKPEGVNWIKIGDTEEGGKYVSSTAQKITPEGAQQSRYVRPGDLILTNSMSYGRPYIMATDGYIHDGWFVLRPNNDIDTEYFYYLLSSRHVQAQFGRLASGSVVKNISGDLVKRAILPIPPISEQRQIVEKLRRLETEEAHLGSIYANKQTNLRALKAAILDHAFSGRL